MYSTCGTFPTGKETKKLYVYVYSFFNIHSAPRCTFKKEMDKYMGMASSCGHTGGGIYNDIDDCKADATESSANVINWNGGQCYFKNCVDVHALQLTSSLGGWDVYVFQCEAGEL